MTQYPNATFSARAKRDLEQVADSSLPTIVSLFEPKNPEKGQAWFNPYNFNFSVFNGKYWVTTNLQFYDAIVDIGGEGQYTSLAAAVADGHETIYLRDGTYELTANLDITYDNCVISGQSKWGTVITGNYKINSSGGNFEISNLRKTSAPTNDYMIVASGNHPKVYDCILTAESGGNNIGVASLTGYNPKFINNKCKPNFDPGGGCYYLNLSGGASEISSNEFITFDDIEIYLNGTNCLFNNNIFNADNGDTSWIDIQAAGARITNNYFNDNGTAGAIIAIEDNSGEAVISDNRCEETCIVVNASYTRVLGNQVDGCTGVGIRVTTGENNVVANNIVKDTGSYGIEIDGTATGQNNVSDNIVENCSDDGIRVEDSDNKISNNIVTSCSGSGIYASGNNESITGNVCDNNTNDGIEDGSGSARDEWVVTGNLCRTNGGYGINWANNPTSTVCTSNMLKGNTTGQLNGAAGANSQFADNVTA